VPVFKIVKNTNKIPAVDCVQARAVLHAKMSSVCLSLA